MNDKLSPEARERARAAERALAGAMVGSNPFRLLEAIQGHLDHGDLTAKQRREAQQKLDLLKEHMPKGYPTLLQ